MQQLTFDYPKTADTILQVRVSFFYVVDQKLYRHEKTYLAKEKSNYGVSEDTNSLDGYPIWFILKYVKYRSITDHAEYERLQKFYYRDHFALQECMQGEAGVDLSKIRLRFRDIDGVVYRIKVSGDSLYFVEYEKQVSEGIFVQCKDEIVDLFLLSDELESTDGKTIMKPSFEEHEIATIVEGESEHPILLDAEMLSSIKRILVKP